MSVDDNKAAVRLAYEAFCSGDDATVLERVAPNFVDHNPDPGQAPGIQGVLEAFAVMRAAFPDLAMSPEDVLADGAKVVARVRISGTHQGEFMGIPASGKTFSTEVIDILRFENGKAVERWGVFDALGMMQQLGAIPS